MKAINRMKIVLFEKAASVKPPPTPNLIPEIGMWFYPLKKARLVICQSGLCNICDMHASYTVSPAIALLSAIPVGEFTADTTAT